jgi:hypothetical protein
VEQGRTVEIDDNRLLPTGEIVCQGVSERWLSVDSGVSNQSLGVDTSKICLDVSSSSLDIGCGESAWILYTERSWLTRSVSVGYQIDHFITDVISQNIVVLTHEHFIAEHR